MISNSVRRAVDGVIVSAMLFVAAQANAACCGGGGTAAYYPSTYSANYAGSYSAYYPATYQTYYGGTGWYPGYYWDRIRTRLWGSPSTYVAAYPTTAYYASAPAYSASYAPSYAVSYAAPSGCASCSTCQSCSASYAPCSSCGSACSTCSTCPTTVTQASYVEPACPNCNAGSTTAATQQNVSSTPSPDPAEPPRTFDSTSTSTTSEASAEPSIPAGASVPEQRQENKPATNGADPNPLDDTATPPEKDPYEVKSTDGATMLEFPKLLDPNDRTAKRSIAPVKTALYMQTAAVRSVSTPRPVTAEQARQDAIGWTSAAK